MFWYEDEVKRVEWEKNNCAYEPRTIFYGSSSIRQWSTLYKDFKDFKPINLGFGGSTLAACVWFFDRIIAPVTQPASIVVYAGDNDLGDGRHPEEVYIFYQQLVARIRQHFNDIPCYYISIKPSISRWNIIDRIRFTNKIIEADIARRKDNVHFVNIHDSMIGRNGFPDSKFFEWDGLHLSPKGYSLWKEILLTHCSFPI